jgi:hypothetical protein
MRNIHRKKNLEDFIFRQDTKYSALKMHENVNNKMLPLVFHKVKAAVTAEKKNS